MTSLMGACCGNDKPNTIPPGASSGRKRSVLLLCLAIAIALLFQYGAAKFIVNMSIRNYVTHAWLDGCNIYEIDSLKECCAGQAGVYRVAFSALIFFALAAVAVAFKKTANREAWPAKYTLFVFLVAAMCFIPNEPVFTSIFLNIARVGTVVFILFQQIIFVDIAHNWNDGWLEKSNKAEAQDSGSGKKWLIAIIISASFFFLTSLVGWGLLFNFFGGCAANTAFISLTVILSLLVTIAQLTGNEGNLLASSLVTAYATMLCYLAVSQNPNAVCNPQLKSINIISIIIGMVLTIVSIGYVGWSATIDSALGKGDEYDDTINPTTQTSLEGKPNVVGVVIENEENNDKNSRDEEAGEGIHEHMPNTFGNNWKLNFALAMVACWFPMVLTGFGSIQANGVVANPQNSEVTMWIIITSQWCALLLYAWMLIAPRIFPDREFS